MVITGYVLGQVGEIVVIRGYYINTILMPGHTPQHVVKRVIPRTLLRHGDVSPDNVPEENKVCVLGVGCGHLVSAS